jgi:hypothetical protein
MAIMEDSLPAIKSFLPTTQVSGYFRSMSLRFMIAILTRHGRNSCMHAASAIDGKPRHRAQPGRFLMRYRQAIADLLANITLKLLDDQDWNGRYLLLLDSTLVATAGQTIENTFSTGNTKRRPAKNRRYTKYKHQRKSCHCFVFALLLTPDGLRVPMWLPYYTKAYAKSRKIKHRTQAMLAAQLIRDAQVPAGIELIVLGDTAFDAKCVRAACDERGYFWIVPVNANRVFSAKKNGKRPRVSSRIEQLPASRFQTIRLSIGSGPYAAQRRASCYRAAHRRDGTKSTRTYHVHSERSEVHSVGMVMLVFSSSKPIGKRIKREGTKLLMTNAKHLSARQVCELYSLRWQIELFFKELKSTLGMSQYSFKDFEAVESWIGIVLITFCYLEWTRARKLADRRIGGPQRKRWTHARSYTVREALLVGIRVREQQWLLRRLKTDHGLRTLRKRYTQLLSQEYRCSA